MNRNPLDRNGWLSKLRFGRVEYDSAVFVISCITEHKERSGRECAAFHICRSCATGSTFLLHRSVCDCCDSADVASGAVPENEPEKGQASPGRRSVGCWSSYILIESGPASVRIAFTKSLTPLATVCILNPAIFSRRPCGELFKQRNWQNNQNPS